MGYVNREAAWFQSTFTWDVLPKSASAATPASGPACPSRPWSSEFPQLALGSILVGIGVSLLTTAATSILSGRAGLSEEGSLPAEQVGETSGGGAADG